MSDYQKLLQKYNELLEEKRTEIELLKEIDKLSKAIERQEMIIKRLRKDNIELSILVKVSKNGN